MGDPATTNPSSTSTAGGLPPSGAITTGGGGGGSMITSSNSNPLFNNSSATHRGIFWLVKLILMFSNAFTGMIGIFIVLFGFAYPEEKFPGDLKGKNCALLSIVYIGWTLIGYCGAHHQKFSFLLIYSALVVLYVFSNIVVFGVLAPKFQWLDANLVWIMCGYFSVLMVCALLLAYQIRLKEDHTTSRYVGNQMPPYYSSGGRFASLRRMGSLRAGYGRHLTRLFGSSGETSQPMANSTMIAAAGNEFGPIYMQHPLPAAYSGGGAMMVNPSQSIAMTTGSRPQQPVLQAGSSSSPQIACALNSPAIGGPTYSAYATYHHPHSSPQLHHQHPKPPYMGPPGAVVGGPAIPMDPPAYGGTYFGRQWQRMSSKRSSLRSSPAVYVNGSNVQYGACELKNLGPGRVNFL